MEKRQHVMESDLMRLIQFTGDTKIEVDFGFDEKTNDNKVEGPILFKHRGEKAEDTTYVSFYVTMDECGNFSKIQLIHNFNDEHYFQPVNTAKNMVLILCSMVYNLNLTVGIATEHDFAQHTFEQIYK